MTKERGWQGGALARDAAAALAILLLNVAIAGRLFRLEYSANLGSNEGQFIALARGVANHWNDLLWWPEWSCGIPFQNTYLPLSHVAAGLYTKVAGVSPALGFHQTAAAFYCLGPVLFYIMARRMSGRVGVGFFTAAAYSLISPSGLIPAIRADLGSVWHLRRVQVLGFYGEAPLTAAMALLPVAILFLWLALTRARLRDRILAGAFAGATVLANAFGAVILACAAAALLAAAPGRIWRKALWVAVIGALAYCWISPAMPPSVIAAIRMNSPTVDGDYRFTTRSLAGAVVLAAGFAALWFASRKAAPHLRFALLFSWLMAGIVTLGVVWRVYVVPQPHRYQLAMDMSVCLLLVSAGAVALKRTGLGPRRFVMAVLVVLMAVQTRHVIRYAHSQIQRTDITKTALYRLSQWADANMRGARMMVGGSYSFYFNNFTDTPQLHGGQDPMLPNFMLRIATFTIYSGMNAGARDGEIAALWLKALGARAVSVPGPESEERYKPFANPAKFEGVLPVIWREGGDTIYRVPARSDSLAHVMNPADLVRDPPVNGLDIAQVERYAAALDAPSYPEPEWRWLSRRRAVIRTPIEPGQVISVQMNYHPGWRATAGGAEQPVAKDGLGFLVVKPACQGLCEISLTFDGGPEWRITLMLSLAVMLFCGVLVARARLRQTRSLDGDGRKFPA